MRRPSGATAGPYVVPGWITLASIVGLVSALVGDGLWDVLSWLTFTTLFVLAARAWLRRDRGK